MILLGYRDHNVHELVCHEIAARAGYYDRLGIDVKAVSGPDHPEAALSAGLGGSLVETLRGQRRWKVALVHTLHPLFWIWTRKGDTRSAGPTVVAGHPEGSIVCAFTQRMLSYRWAGHGTPSMLRFPAGSAGDRQRLEALRSGEADAAVLAPHSLPAPCHGSGSPNRCSSASPEVPHRRCRSRRGQDRNRPSVGTKGRRRTDGGDRQGQEQRSCGTRRRGVAAPRRQRDRCAALAGGLPVPSVRSRST